MCRLLGTLIKSKAWYISSLHSILISSTKRDDIEKWNVCVQASHMICHAAVYVLAGDEQKAEDLATRTVLLVATSYSLQLVQMLRFARLSIAFSAFALT